MLKRIFTIALFTGAGQLFVIFALKYISQHSSPEHVKAIGEIDSLVLFITNIIGFGLQSATMRNLALAEDWKQDYLNTQSARLTLGLIITGFAILAIFDLYYLAFLIAPLLALSGDYALYGRGYPVKGAFIAFTRAFAPFLVVVLFIKIDAEWINLIYLLSLSIVYLISNKIISKFLTTRNFVLPRLHNLKLYFDSFSLGIVSLAIYTFGLGLALVSSYFYSAAVIAITYTGLKFYVLFKGVLRIIHQAFIKDMIDDKISLKIDQLSSLIGLTFATFLLIFPNTFISLFFGQQYTSQTHFFILIALAGFIYSLFASITTTSLLEKKDLTYATIYAIAALLPITLVIGFSVMYNSAFVISLSLFIGELVFIVLAFVFLSSKKYISNRLIFYVKNLLFIIIPLGFRFVFADSLIPFIFSGILFLAAISLTYFKKFLYFHS